MADHHIGLIVPSSNLTMETELPRMLNARASIAPDDRFVFHTSRMRMKHVTPDELRDMNAQTERAALELADARPDVVATACLVAIMAQGPGHHCVAEADITSALRSEGSRAPVVSSAGALLSGVEALGARRVAIITPYMKELTAKVADYLEDAGIEVVDALSLEVPDNLAVARLDPADLRDHWRRLNLSGADALVLSACVQMPSLASIQPVEDEAGLPVLSAATSTAFSILTELGLPPVVPGAGSLLGGRLSGPAGSGVGVRPDVPRRQPCVLK
ncbi:maleate cis-trans isomerase family protein [Streptomyces rhizosphaericus]|uniref:Maleate isomerase n=1 Tax=Streptomyces rhizosphaericus TaxID=114699 RepID=A0A6G4ALK5_9ACTN|nr:aspartate/glutamate racemase family protein [Streptomyces rhizosphaericus]NEW74122.1 Asp/Glu racemase [Streptomyces rhizosphaericus]